MSQHRTRSQSQTQSQTQSQVKEREKQEEAAQSALPDAVSIEDIDFEDMKAWVAEGIPPLPTWQELRQFGLGTQISDMDDIIARATGCRMLLLGTREGNTITDCVPRNPCDRRPSVFLTLPQVPYSKDPDGKRWEEKIIQVLFPSDTLAAANDEYLQALADGPELNPDEEDEEKRILHLYAKLVYGDPDWRRSSERRMVASAKVAQLFEAFDWKAAIRNYAPETARLICADTIAETETALCAV